jgi:hypothetical protein
MIVFALAAQLAITTPADSTTVATPPQQGRPKAVEVSEGYATRLTIHRRVSYALIPMFGLQTLAGWQIWEKGNTAPGWARTGHRIGATAIAGAFTVNVVTGVWNLWDSRSQPEGRALRYLHAAAMLTASAGFTYAGAYLSEEAETNLDARELHRTIALSSLGLTAVSGILMKILND